MPVFVFFESSDTVEHQEIPRVIDEAEEVHLTRDTDLGRVHNDRKQVHVLAVAEARWYCPRHVDTRKPWSPSNHTCVAILAPRPGALDSGPPLDHG